MCITKVDSYEYAGVLFPTEFAAVDAALTALVNPMGNFPGAELKRQLIVDAEKLIDLLTRHKRLTDAMPKVGPANEKV